MAGELGIPGLTGADEIGRGGTGVVYLSRHDVSGRAVAVKILDQIVLDDEGASRFRHDFVTIADATDDESVVTVLAVGVLPIGHPYLVLEYVSGESLGTILATGKLETSAAIHVLLDTCAAVDRIHAAGMVHGDITSNNVLLTAEGRARLSGFGIVEYFTGGSNSVALTISPVHAAPEVLAGKKRTPASDVWALGSVLLDAVSRTAPFGPRSAPNAELVARALDGRAPDYSAAPTSLHAVLGASLLRDPAMRCSAAKMTASLRAILEAPQAVAAPLQSEPPIAISTTVSRKYRPIPKGRGIFSDSPPPPIRRRVLGAAAAIVLVIGIFVTAVATRPTESDVDPRCGFVYDDVNGSHSSYSRFLAASGHHRRGRTDNDDPKRRNDNVRS